jgi:hypothetical protein
MIINEVNEDLVPAVAETTSDALAASVPPTIARGYAAAAPVVAAASRRALR